MLSLLFALFAGVMAFGVWEEQGAECVNFGHMSMVSGVFGVKTLPPWATMDGVYELEGIFQIFWSLPHLQASEKKKKYKKKYKFVSA